MAIAVTDDTQWASLAGLLQLRDYPDTWQRQSARKADEAEVDSVVADAVAGWKVADLVAAARAAGIPAGKVSNAADLLTDPQLAHRDHWVRLRHPEMGETVYNAPAFRMSRTPGALTRPAPCLGEHTDEILAGVLKMSPDEIQQLKSTGALQ